MTYGNIIRRLRSERNMTLIQFASLVGTSKSHIQRLENEESSVGGLKLSPSVDTLKQICDRTGYPFRQFLEEAGYIEAVPIPPPHPLVAMYERMTPFQKDSLMLFAKGLLGEEALKITPEGYFDLSRVLNKN